MKLLKKLYRKYTLKETKRLCDLDVLIEMCMSRMKYKPLYCPICALHEHRFFVEMVFRRSRIIVQKNIPIRDDVGLKCPECNHTLHVGNPMTRKDAEHEIYLRGSPYLMTPTYSPKEQFSEEIKERLKALGYGY